MRMSRGGLQNIGASPENRNRFALLDGCLIVFLAALAIALRGIHLSEQSVWYDEYITIRFADAPSLLECLREQLQWDWHMVPVYHTFEYYAYQWSGGSVMAVRGLSVLFAAGSAIVIYLLGRRLYGAWAGAVAGALFAMSPFHIFHGQEIRPYSLVTLLAMLSVYCFVRAVAGDGRRWWMLHAAFNLALMWTHLLAAILLAPLGLFLILLHARAWRRTFLWGMTHVFFLMFIVLWIHSLQGGMDSPKAPPPPAKALWDDWFHRDPVYLHWVFGSLPLDKTPEEIGSVVHRILMVQPRYENVLAWSFAAACALLLVGSLVQSGIGGKGSPNDRQPPPLQAVVLLLLIFTIPSTILFALTWATRLELFQARFSAYSSPALYLMAGGFVANLGVWLRPSRPDSRIAHGVRAMAAAGIVFLMGVQTVLGVGLPIRQGYLAAARTLRTEKHEGEKLVAHGLYTQWLLAYNLGDPPMPAIESHGFDGLCHATDALLQSKEPFWVVLTAVPPHCPWPPDMSGLAERYAAYLTERGAPFETKRFLGMQNVHLFHVTAFRASS